MDAANTSPGNRKEGDGGLVEAAEYLYEVLLMLQKRYTSAKSSKGPAETPVLIASNKTDLFTALPAPLVKTALEAEITRIRQTRAQGLLDSGVGKEDLGDEKEWLGAGGGSKFEFSQMEEFNVPVTIKGGNVMDNEKPDAGQWWEWVAAQL